MSDLDTELNADEVTFEKFGRTWSVPAKRHHTHIRRTKEILRAEGQLDGDDLAEIYLSPEQFAELLALDVDDDQLVEFANEIGRAVGTGDAGNSKPSPASS